LLEVRTAGSPDDEDLIFTDLTPPQLSQEMEKLGTPVSPQPIADWLHEAGVRLRKISKCLAGGESEERNAQFENIACLIEQYENAGNPWFSIDTKAKEHLGTMYRQGRSYCSAPFQAFDHDFPSWADGVVIPHGIYDRQRNVGHINLGLSRDTTEFACESFRYFWNTLSKRHYADASSIMLTCDCGGSNSALKYLFKFDLQRLVNQIKLPIRIAHYPSYCSKYNPIERRFFPHVGRACTGKLLENLDRVVELMRKTSTTTGLHTTVHVLKKIYGVGRIATKAMRATLNIIYDKMIPRWNYVIYPNMR
jgi:hypothetical protein